MYRSKTKVLLLVVTFSLALTVPVLAAAPAEGVVYEGVSVPGIALGDSREQVEAAYGQPSSCRNINEPNDQASCTFDVEGGGSVIVRYQAPDGGDATGSPEDVVAHIRWNDDVVGWRTSAGITIQDIYYDRQLAVDTYPNATLTYNDYGTVIRLTDYDLGISISWDAVYIFYSVSMSIFTPYTPPPPPPPPDYVRVADIEMSYDRRSVTARVLVLDEQDQPVEGAAVLAWWVYPKNNNNNTNMYVNGITDGDGYSTFRIDKAARGDYRITINNVTAEGYAFDTNNSVLVGVITKPK